MKVKKLILTWLACVVFSTAFAQNDFQKFDPVKFRHELVEFIVNEAELTPAEKSAVVPIYDEFLLKKQALFKEMSKYRHFQGDNDNAYKNAIEDMNRISIEMKTLQQTYHRKLFKVITAKKVYALIRAEKHFNKQCLQKVTRH